MERPCLIPAWAINVRQVGNLWLWEFSGGAVVELAYVDGRGEPYQHISLRDTTLRALLADLRAHEQRYEQAIAQELARQDSYEAYMDYEADDDEVGGEY